MSSAYYVRRYLCRPDIADGQYDLPTGVVNLTNSWSTRELQLRPLMEIVENSLTVLQLAELDLKRADLAWSAEQTCQWMHENSFDAAPLDEPDPYRFVGASWLESNGAPVIGQARLIDATLLVSSDLGLADGVSRLKAHPYYFVLQRDNLQGIVTRADLQRPAVGMVLFSLILTSEAAANVIIDRCLGPTWIEHLTVEQRSRVNEIFNQRLRTNTQVTRLECLCCTIGCVCSGNVTELSQSWASPLVSSSGVGKSA